MLVCSVTLKSISLSLRNRSDALFAPRAPLDYRHIYHRVSSTKTLRNPNLDINCYFTGSITNTRFAKPMKASINWQIETKHIFLSTPLTRFRGFLWPPCCIHVAHGSTRWQWSCDGCNEKRVLNSAIARYSKWSTLSQGGKNICVECVSMGSPVGRYTGEFMCARVCLLIGLDVSTCIVASVCLAVLWAKTVCVCVIIVCCWKDMFLNYFIYFYVQTIHY